MLKCSKAKYFTEMFTVWVSATDWEMLEMSVVSVACPDLSWARHWGNPDNAWPRIWLLNPWHLLVTSYNYSGSYNATGTLIIPSGVIQTPSSLHLTPSHHINTEHRTRLPGLLPLFCAHQSTLFTPQCPGLWLAAGCHTTLWLAVDSCFCITSIISCLHSPPSHSRYLLSSCFST